MDEIDKIRAQWAKQRPDIDTEPMALIGRLQRTARHLSEEMGKNFSAHSLKPMQFDVLATLLRAGPPHALSPNQLISAMMITSGTMTNRIDSLVGEGLVERIGNPEDKRSVLIALTKTGRERIDKAVTDHVETQARLTAILSTEEKQILNGILKKYLAAKR